MAADLGGPPRSGLINRVTNIIMHPRSEWEVIDGEPATPGGLYTGYVLIIAAIPALITLLNDLFLKTLFSGIGSIFGVVVHISPVYVLISALISYALTLVMVYVLALIANAMAPSFNAVRDPIQALKVSAYSITAVCIASVCIIVPILGALVVLAACIYTIFILHTGLRTLMKTPQENAIGYTAAVIVASLVAALLIALVVQIPMKALQRSAAFGRGGAVSVQLPNGVEINARNAEDIKRNAERILHDNNASPADPDSLEALLPASLDGYNRTDLSTSTGSLGGIGGSQTKATFENGGGGRIALTITDIGALGALTGIAQGNTRHQTDDGYESASSSGGRMITEEYHNESHRGSYKVITGHFAVEAEGRGVDMDQLKAAAAKIDLDKLDKMSEG